MKEFPCSSQLVDFESRVNHVIFIVRPIPTSDHHNTGSTTISKTKLLVLIRVVIYLLLGMALEQNSELLF